MNSSSHLQMPAALWVPTDTNDLVEALGQAQEGIPPFSPGLAAKLLREFSRIAAPPAPAAPADILPTPSSSKPAIITPRQMEVLEIVSQGLSYKEVGAKLSLSARMVRYHMVEIMDQLHLANRAEVIAYAGLLGLSGQESDN